ncbi:phospholipase D-like domain-containing protein [uncultured Thiodictyon sp.]|jgi:hypothetical protein|uniref:phospholipase D-like domain-containing protein n=1 Tax=uncultured Thiodictyon sp. TaxID=1846217 RepID=UPI0025D4A9CA|nr:phospholipase D-like domain-containing protein [uncultured Thiodictyon sp.]
MSIQRFSSRRERLDHAFLRDRLRHAKSYKRIAGYFRSSIFELVGEEIAGIAKVQIVCNSELDAADVAVSRHVRETALKERWNRATPEVEALLHADRYRYLHDLLTSGRVEIRVVPKERVFLHGKAGVIEATDGSKTCFLGSINETKRAFAGNYEILWEDRSAEGVAWVEEEFDALWADAYPLPNAIVEEIERVAKRVEVRFEDTTPQDLPAAALAESPIYRHGEQLQPWQRSFVTLFLTHRETYGKVRLLLADEVGVGKTLSLAACAMVATLLDDGPVLILCPSTLTLQWQVELADRLGIPSAVWSSTKKVWIDPKGHVIKTRGAEDIARCPFRIAIVSTGLIFQASDGLLRTLILQRICSSFASGRATAERLLRRELLEDEEDAALLEEPLSALTAEEADHLLTIVRELSRPEARDPKLNAVLHFLTNQRTEGKTWLAHGCIVFSQYYDTALAMARQLAGLLPGEPVAVYAGAGKSGLFRGQAFASVEREEIKAAVKDRTVRLLLATDAACEGLNLQTLGTLINVDLPWNPVEANLQRQGALPVGSGCVSWFEAQ